MSKQNNSLKVYARKRNSQAKKYESNERINHTPSVNFYDKIVYKI